MSHCHHFQQGGKDELDPAYLCLHSIKESSPKCTSCPTLAEEVQRGQAYLSPFKSPSLSFHFFLFSWDNGKEGRNSQHPHLQSFYQPQQALSWTPHESASQTRDCTGGLPLSPDAILQANLLLTGSFLHGSCFSQINLCRLQMALWGITALVHRLQRSPARGEECTLEIQMCVLPKCLSHFGAIASCSHEIFLCGLVCAGQHKGGECSAECQTALSMGLV